MKYMMGAIVLFCVHSANAMFGGVPGDTHFDNIQYLYDNGTMLDIAKFSGQGGTGRCFYQSDRNNALASYFTVNTSVENLGPIADAAGVFYIGFDLNHDSASAFDNTIFDKIGDEARPSDATTYSTYPVAGVVRNYRQSSVYVVMTATLNNVPSMNCYYYNITTP